MTMGGFIEVGLVNVHWFESPQSRRRFYLAINFKALWDNIGSTLLMTTRGFM